MASPTAPTIDATGISAPQFADILAYLQNQYRAIYGDDIYLGNDSQDGQFLGILAAAINDSNQAAIAVYNSFSPATAQGNGLSSTVKINGIARLVASNSQVTVDIVGVAGTTITGGIVSDINNNSWNLPATLTIPPEGTITVTATAQDVGAIVAAPNTVTTIQTPTYGWQSVNNPNAASPGSPVETDAQLRLRQSNSTMNPSLTVLEGIVGAVSNLTGVDKVKAYENDTDVTDDDGLPPHSIAMVVQGGDALEIATTIAVKKTPGAYTYGDIEEIVYTTLGPPSTIRFFEPDIQEIAVEIELQALAGYTTNVAAEIKAAVAAYINGLTIGQSIYITRLYVPAMLNFGTDYTTYEINFVKAAIKPGTPGTSDIAIGFKELATCAIADISITVV